MKKSFVLLVLLLVMPFCFVKAQDKKTFEKEWSGLVEYVPVDFIEYSEMFLLFSSVDSFGDGYVMSSLDTETSFASNVSNSVLAIYDKNGNEKKKIVMEEHAILEVASSSDSVYALVTDFPSYSEIFIVKYDDNLNEIKRVVVESDLNIFLESKSFGFDLFGVSHGKLYVGSDSMETAYEYELDLNSFNEFSILDNQELLCEVLPSYCSLLNSVYPEYVYGYYEKDNYVVETGFTNDGSRAGLVKFYKDNELVFEKTFSEYEIIINPQIIDNHIVIIADLDTSDLLFNEIIVLDFEGNIVDKINGLLNLYNIGDGNNFLTLSIDLEEENCPTYIEDDICLIARYDYYNLDYVGGSSIVNISSFAVENEQFKNVFLTSENGFVAISSNDDIVKYNSGNSIEWKHNLKGNMNDYFTEIIETSDEGYLVIGRSNSSFDNVVSYGDYDALILKYDKNGNLLWHKNYGGSDSDGFSSVIEDEDGNYVAVGDSDSSDIDGITSPSNKFGIIVKFDKNGNLLWHDYTKHNAHGSFYDLVNSSNNGYIVVGYANNGYGYIIKYDKDGNVVWEDLYSDFNSFSFNHIDVLTDGNYVVVGRNTYSDKNVNLLKYDDNGNKLIEDTYGKLETWFDAIVPTSDGGFVACGGTYIFNQKNLIVKYDKYFNIEWKVNKSSDIDFICIKEVQKNSFVLVGVFEDNASIYKFDYYPIIRTVDTLNGDFDIEICEDKGVVALNPDKGYTLDTLSIINSDGDEVEYYEEDGKYYFMLDKNVWVNVTYKKEVINPNTITFFKIGFVTLILFTLYNLFIAKRFKIKKYI